MKKLLVILLITAASAAFAQNGSDFKVRTANGQLTITGYTGAGGAVVIPATIGGKPVVKIGGFAFTLLFRRIAITSISIPASVTRIGDWAFLGCTGLTSILVDANNTHYTSRDGVLFNKAGDTLIAYPVGLKGQYAIPANVTCIGSHAFSGCTGLTSVSIPANVTDIEGFAFYDCTGLTSILVDANNTHYTSRDGVLFNKAGDTLIAYPTGLKGQYAIPVSVTGIGDGAFSGCTGLSSVSIPASVTDIGWEAFYGCTGLTTVSIPASVTTIGDQAFWGCTGFDGYYDTNGKKAGGYTYRNDAWSYTAQ